MTETQPHSVHDDAAAAGRRRTGQAGAGGSRGQVVEAVGGRPDLRVRPDEVARGDLLDRHPAADGVRDPALRQRLLLHPVATSSPATSGCAARRSSTRSAGTTTACPPSAGCRTSSASAATRRCRTTPTSRRPRSRTRSGRCRSDEQNFIELCERLTAEDEVAFEALFRQVGLSVDWNYLYRTIGEDCRVTSQRAFLRNLARGEAYLQESPTLWDVTFQSAVAQAELEAREYPGHYYRVAFHGRGRALSGSRPPGPS